MLRGAAAAAGVEDGMMLSAGEVEAGGKGRPTTELFVTVHVEEHPVFERHGANVVVHSTLDMVDAALGTDITCAPLPPAPGSRLPPGPPPPTPALGTAVPRGAS